jgi:monofunctional biosynthetic peptidoglycan transglycosylase
MKLPFNKPLYKFWGFYFFSYVLLFLLFFLYLYFTLPDVTEWTKKNPAQTTLMKYREKDQDYLAHRARRIYQWTPYRDIPELMRQTVIVAEDASFWIHHGIDWFEVRESLKKNLEEGEFARGGSTITQQLAKNLYLKPDKEISRKFKEWLIAWKLEDQMKKTRILELYLNVVEWGYNVFGIGAASKVYFGKAPADLTLDEMVRLAAVLPNPLEMNPTRVNYAVFWRSRIILKRLEQYDYISEDEFEFTLALLQYMYEQNR